MTFGDRLAYVRKKKGLSREQLGKLVGVKGRAVCDWELGNKSPKAYRLLKIAEALEVSEDWLIGNSGDFEMKDSMENPKSMKLTEEQQRLVDENERLIGYVSCKLCHLRMNSELYEYCYGYAAIGLCKAAKVMNKLDYKTFAGLACKWILFEVRNAMNRFYRYREVYQPLSLDAPLCPGADDDFGSLISSPDKMELLEYKILAESVYQRVEPVLTPTLKKAFKPWLHGKQETEIAKALGVSRNVVKARIYLAKKQCRALFSPDEMFTAS